MSANQNLALLQFVMNERPRGAAKEKKTNREFRIKFKLHCVDLCAWRSTGRLAKAIRRIKLPVNSTLETCQEQISSTSHSCFRVSLLDIL